MPDNPPPPPPPPPPPKPPLFLTFNGPITHPATNKFRVALCNIVAQGYTELTILFSSGGGVVDDGVALYSLLRSLPLKLSMHNMGGIDSIAIPIFLAADVRSCSPVSRFLFHDVLIGIQAGQVAAPQLGEWPLLVENLRNTIMEILKLNASFTDENLKAVKFLKESTIINATTAKEMGIVQEIKEFKLPLGAHYLNLEY